MAPEIPESAAPASVPAALPLANLQPPMDDVKRNAPTSLLAAAEELVAARGAAAPEPSLIDVMRRVSDGAARGARSTRTTKTA